MVVVEYVEGKEWLKTSTYSRWLIAGILSAIAEPDKRRSGAPKQRTINRNSKKAVVNESWHSISIELTLLDIFGMN